MGSGENLVRGLEELLDDSQVVADLCNQFGDSGKGKISDLISFYWADVIARGTGADNAGHTVEVNDKKTVYHLLPAGIAHDRSGKVNILGNGMAINPLALAKEIGDVVRDGMTYNNLMVSRDAAVIMPYHVELDQDKFQSLKRGGVGSTGKGVGPAYADKGARRAIFVSDLLDRDRLAKKMEAVRPAYEWEINVERKRFNAELRELAEKESDAGMRDQILAKLKPEYRMNIDEIIASFEQSVSLMSPLIRDTVSEIHRFYSEGRRILLEGAQGLFLSLEHGIHPYITASDCSLNGTATGVGLSANVVDMPLGIIKFPFMTRVGGGPFVTEIGGRAGELYCAQESGNRRGDELKRLGIQYEEKAGDLRYDRDHPMILEMLKSDNAIDQAVALRLRANEFGATTARPRRLGWTDAVLGKYAVGVNGPLFVLTKVDCVEGMSEFNVCYGYTDDARLSLEYVRDNSFMGRVKPALTRYEGFDRLGSPESIDEMPGSLREAISDFEDFTNGKVAMVSYGPKRHQTFVENEGVRHRS